MTAANRLIKSASQGTKRSLKRTKSKGLQIQTPVQKLRQRRKTGQTRAYGLPQVLMRPGLETNASFTEQFGFMILKLRSGTLRKPLLLRQHQPHKLPPTTMPLGHALVVKMVHRDKAMLQEQTRMDRVMKKMPSLKCTWHSSGTPLGTSTRTE